MCSGSAVSRWQECFISTALAFPVPLFTLWEPLFSDKTDISFFALKVKTSQITTFGNIFISWTSCDLFVIQANLSKPIFCQVGDAGIVQRSPLRHNGRDSRYKNSPLPVRRYISLHVDLFYQSCCYSLFFSPQDSLELPEELRLSSLLSSYSARNLSLRLENEYKVSFALVSWRSVLKWCCAFILIVGGKLPFFLGVFYRPRKARFISLIL